MKDWMEPGGPLPVDLTAACYGLVIERAKADMRILSPAILRKARRADAHERNIARAKVELAEAALDWMMSDNEEHRRCPSEPCNRGSGSSLRYRCHAWREGGECVSLTFMDCCAALGWSPLFVRERTMAELKAKGIGVEELDDVA